MRSWPHIKPTLCLHLVLAGYTHRVITHPLTGHLGSRGLQVPVPVWPCVHCYQERRWCTGGVDGACDACSSIHPEPTARNSPWYHQQRGPQVWSDTTTLVPVLLKQENQAKVTTQVCILHKQANHTILLIEVPQNYSWHTYSTMQIQLLVSLAQNEIQLALTIIYHTFIRKIHQSLQHPTSLWLPG